MLLTLDTCTLMIQLRWEWETLEVGFVMVFLCPLVPWGSAFPAWLPAPRMVLWLLRWLLRGRPGRLLARLRARCLLRGLCARDVVDPH